MTKYYIDEEDLSSLVSHHLETWKNKKNPNKMIILFRIFFIVCALVILLLLPLVLLLTLIACILYLPVYLYYEKKKNQTKPQESPESG